MVRRDDRRADRMPAEVTSLVGRQSETAEIKRLLTRTRLVTLTGPGGVGKSRLARHVARTVRAAVPDGVYLVPLAELSQPDLVADTILAGLGESGGGGADADNVVARIGERQMLLLLDNCEHLTAAVARLVATLLYGCPHLRVLATSREALRVEGEALYRVPPLGLPADDAPIADGSARNYDGVALFLDRAGVLNEDVAAGKVDDKAVVELCRRLDGLPLAIELAAAGTRWQSVESMLSRPLAPAGPVARAVPDRHQSVRATLDYSHGLCSPDARMVWALSSVFRGGATLAAVQMVSAATGVPAEVAGAALAELVDKSVVVLDGSRYTMLETVRQYGALLLAEAGEEAAAKRAHLACVEDLAQGLEESWFGPHQRELLATVQADQANVRAALEHSLEDPTTARRGLCIATALWPFWIGSGLPGEGRRWLRGLLAASGDEVPERAPALWTQGFLSAVDGDIASARSLLAECMTIAERHGDRPSVARALCTLGVADLFDGELDAAIDNYEAGIAQERAVSGSTPYLADALINLGLAYCYRGDLERANAVLKEGTELCVAHKEELLLSWALGFQALAALLEERPGDADALARQSLQRKRDLNNQQGMVWAVELLAWAAVAGGDAERGAVLLAAAAARAEDFGPAFHGFAGMREWHERYDAQARKQLGTAVYGAASARGSRLSLEQLLAVALGEAAEQEGDVSLLADLPLTPREREIAELVGSGRTNREIAEALVIAPRTVDTHVQHILTKLDFTSRHQVVALVAGLRASSA